MKAHRAQITLQAEKADSIDRQSERIEQRSTQGKTAKPQPEKPVIHRQPNRDQQAKLQAFRRQEAERNAPRSEQEKSKAREDFERAAQNRARDKGQDRGR